MTRDTPLPDPPVSSARCASQPDAGRAPRPILFSTRRALPLTLATTLALAGACRPGAPEERETPAVSDGASAPRDLPPSRDAPRTPTPDEKLAEDVKNAFLQAPALSQENIRIAAVGSQVLLMGDVSAPHLRDEAVRIAGQVPGVESVQSKIVVRRR